MAATLTQFKKGLMVKPASVSNTGDVTFTDGANELKPNQYQCEAYGYTYDSDTGVCKAFEFSTTLRNSFTNETNTVQGQGNTSIPGATNTYMLGENNTANNLTRNNIIIGNNNQITENVNNSSVFGTLGEATVTNSIVLGGNNGADNLGERQSIQALFGVTTTDGSVTKSLLNNTADSYFTVPENTILYFHADVVAVRVAGTAGGNKGDFKSWVERGVVINESGTLSIQRERDVIKSTGTTTGWQPTGGFVGTDFFIYVQAAAGMTVEWACNTTFTQIKTGVAL